MLLLVQVAYSQMKSYEGFVSSTLPFEYDGYSHFFTFSPYVTGSQAATHTYPPRTRCYSIDDMDGEAFVAFGGDGITLQRTYTALDFRSMIGCMWGYLAGISTYSAPPITSFTDPLQVMEFTTSISVETRCPGSDINFKYCATN